MRIPQTPLPRVAVLVLTAFVLATGQLGAADPSWFVGGKLGTASGEALFGERHPKGMDDDSEAGAVEVGYRLNRYLAVQAGYHDLGSYSGFGSACRQGDDACIERLATLGLCAFGRECLEVVADLETEVTGLSLALVPSYPLGDRVTLLGKVGVMSWDADVRGRESFVQREEFSGDDLVAGVGLEYGFSNGVGISLEHERLDLDVDSTSLGLRWRF